MIDAKRLARDAKAAGVQRLNAATKIAGVVCAIGECMPAIAGLRGDGVTWASIAAALSQQGLTQRNGRPLTASRVTAIVSYIQNRDHKRDEKALRRVRRNDLSREVVPRARARSDTSAARSSFNHEHETRSEEQIRRDGLKDLHNLLGRSE
jgi:hypothetical protein